MTKSNSIFDYLKENLAVFVFIGLCLVFPLLRPSDYIMRVMVEVFFFGALGTAWNILGGFGQQISWASASFFATGAYTSMLMYLRLGGVSPWISIWVGMALAVLLAIIIGIPCFRLRGVYFAIATIACASIVRQLLLYFRGFTGGSLGLAFQVRTQESFVDLFFVSDVPYYYITLFWMLITVGVTIGINRSRLGYYLKAIREDDIAAESLGIRAHRMKLLAFIISSMLMAATGTFYAFKVGYIDPFLVASHDMSVRIGITAILGGMGTIWGPVLGAFVAVPLLELSNYFLSDFGGGGAGYAMYGLLIVLVVLYRPNGLISLLNDLPVRLGKKGRPTQTLGN
ncbi:MAG: branched-chain amino acid ABC transporter permease [Limnochordia bacterium]|jgi:branched-chain amino acid transport system permease protein